MTGKRVNMAEKEGKYGHYLATVFSLTLTSCCSGTLKTGMTSLFLVVTVTCCCWTPVVGSSTVFTVAEIQIGLCFMAIPIGTYQLGHYIHIAAGQWMLYVVYT